MTIGRAQPRPGTAPGPAPMDVRTRVLANGLTIASVRLPGFRTAAVGAFVRVGSRDEPAALNGISHFLEHMAFKGTETRDARRISLEIERVGASMNAYTAKDHTAYHTVLLAEHMAVALDVLADVIRRSTFPVEEIERERVYDAPVVTQVQPVPRYWPGEAYHQRYYERNPYQGYCMVVVGPKVAKFRKQFKSHLKAR